MNPNNHKKRKRTLIELIRTTFIGGFVIILPAYLAILAFNKMLKGLIALIPAFVKPIVSLLPFGEDSAVITIPLAWLIFILICLIAGVIVRTSFAAIIKKTIEPALKKIPGYLLIRSITNRMIRLEQKEELEVGFVALGEPNQSLSPAFFIDHHDNGYYTVFVPTVPTPTVGNLYVVHGNRVFPIDVPFLDMVKFITRWGEGSPELREAIKNIKVPQNNLPPTQ